MVKLIDRNWNLNLKTNTPIKVENLTFYPLSLDYIMNTEDYGYEVFKACLFPFKITKDYILVTEDLVDKEDELSINIFNDYIINNELFTRMILITLMHFCKINFEDIKIKENTIFIKNGNNGKLAFINSGNFDIISNIILAISGEDKVEIEKPPKNMSVNQKSIWKKLQDGRRIFAEKNAIYLQDKLNICEFAGQYHIPIEKLMKMTLWNIENCYNSIITMHQHEDLFSAGLVTGDFKEITNDKHWIKKLCLF